MSTPDTVSFIEALARGLVFPQRTPILRRPDDVGLAYEDVFFPAIDGVTLEGWFIPADSDRLVICNHFGPANRQGYPGHLEGFPASNGVSVDFLPKYKALHDAGYNVLAYDLRNHGMSASWGGGISGSGIYEWRDVLGSLRYARARPDTAGMQIHLHSLCMGCNGTFIAMQRQPEAFAGVASLIAIQPLVGATLIRNACAMVGIPDGVAQLDPVLQRLGSQRVSDHDVRPFAEAVCVPTLVLQVRQDMNSSEADVQEIFDRIPVADKDIHWIEDTPIRHHGYTYFSEHPERMVAWYDAHSR
ncbi:MAG: alpha/beta hydrolase [Myxococcota bacterium]